jgi:hypothetical protein
MHSSTSGSDWLTPARAIWLLAISLLVYVSAVEVATRIALPRFSEELQRETRDHRAAVRLHADSRSVLLVGNSLLLYAIDRSQLTAAMGPAYDVVLYPVESTTYLDWYFGLRRLFAEGARPRLVVLCLNATNVLSDATEGDAFAHALMRLADLPAVARAGHLDLMTASEYFFANRSAFLGDRAHLHHGLMSRWLPNASLLARYLPIQHPASLQIGPAGIEREVERLQRVRELSAAYGAQFIFLVPPSPNRADPAQAIRSAAQNAGISVLVPYVPGELPGTAFIDGFHLNQRGAVQFTDRVARALLRPAGWNDESQLSTSKGNPLPGTAQKAAGHL